MKRLFLVAALALAACQQTPNGPALRTITLDLPHAQQIAARVKTDVHLAVDSAGMLGLIPANKAADVAVALRQFDVTADRFAALKEVAPGQVDPRALAVELADQINRIVQLTNLPADKKVAVQLGATMLAAFVQHVPVVVAS